MGDGYVCMYKQDCVGYERCTRVSHSLIRCRSTLIVSGHRPRQCASCRARPRSLQAISSVLVIRCIEKVFREWTTRVGSGSHRTGYEAAGRSGVLRYGDSSNARLTRHASQSFIACLPACLHELHPVVFSTVTAQLNRRSASRISR